MKLKFKVFSLLFLMIPFIGFTQKKSNIKKKSKTEIKEEHQEFMEEILENHIKLIGKIIKFSDHIGDLENKKEKIAEKKQKLEESINDEISRLEKIKDVRDTNHLDSVIGIYKRIKDCLNNEYNLAAKQRLNLKFEHSYLNDFIKTLSTADKNIVAAETFMYELNKNFSKHHRLSLDKKFDELHKKVIKNEKAIYYHNSMLLQFYKIYEVESDFIKQKLNTKDSTLTEKYIQFADEVFVAEDTINMKGAFEGDGSFAFAVKEYFKYIRNQYFENFAFYNQYMKNVERKRLEATKNKKKGKVENNKKHDQFLRTAQSKLKASYSNLSGQRGDILLYIEESSYDFLYLHCPDF